MFSFTATIQKFSNKGEKTGWTYVELPPDILGALRLASKKEFRLKGYMDQVAFEQLACYPVGDGSYVIALNAELRKKLGKKEGAMLGMKIALDKSAPPRSEDLIACLQEDAAAKAQFETLTPSHQNYFHNYVRSAKTLPTITARVLHSLNALHNKQNFGEMIRGLKEKRR